MPRVLTGSTPSGNLHIGNYFGAMRPAIGLQAGSVHHVPASVRDA